MQVETILEVSVVLVLMLGVFAWVLVGATASLTNRSKHFSVRTLLIVTTIVAFVLGAYAVILKGN